MILFNKKKNRKIKIFLSVVLIFSIYILPVATALAQEVLFSLTVQAESPIQPETPTQPTPSQGNYNPPSQPPLPEQPFPVWVNITQINNQYLSNLLLPYQFTDRILTFRGQTNVLDAVLFLNVLDNPNITYTTNIYNQEGFWQLTIPYTLPVGEHTINVVALNPHDPTITSQTSLTFEIVDQILPPVQPEAPQPPIPPPAPVPPPLPETPTLPPTLGPEAQPTPGEIIPTRPLPGQVAIVPQPGIVILDEEGQPEIFSLNIKVLNKNKLIFPKGRLETEVELYYFGKKTWQIMDLRFLVLDSKQQIIMDSKQEVAFRDHLVFSKNFLTSFTITPGRYTIVIELTKNNHLIQANDFFLVSALPLFKPSALGLGEINFTGNLFLMVSLSFISINFFILLYLESLRKRKNNRKIKTNDLINSHYINLG